MTRQHVPPPKKKNVLYTWEMSITVFLSHSTIGESLLCVFFLLTYFYLLIASRCSLLLSEESVISANIPPSKLAVTTDDVVAFREVEIPIPSSSLDNNTNANDRAHPVVEPSSAIVVGKCIFTFIFFCHDLFIYTNFTYR